MDTKKLDIDSFILSQREIKKLIKHNNRLMACNLIMMHHLKKDPSNQAVIDKVKEILNRNEE